MINELYFFGGFGDRSYIGWIPIETFRNVTQKEIDEYRLPGEKGYQPARKSMEGLKDQAFEL